MPTEEFPIRSSLQLTEFVAAIDEDEEMVALCKQISPAALSLECQLAAGT